MKKSRNTIVITVFIFLAIVALYFSYQFGYRGKIEPKTTSKVTNTDPVYDFKTFTFALQAYREFYKSAIEVRSTEIDHGTYVVPGLKSTRTLISNHTGECAICTSMTPQGIAVSEKYIFVSSYCHTRKHNSVIYVIDKASHEFIKELVLPGKPHVGSIAYDTQFDNLWVCGSNDGKATANAIALETIEKYSFDEGYQTISYLHEDKVIAVPRSSFMAYFNGHLYIGYFNTKGNSIMEKYQVEDNGDIKKVYFSKDRKEEETSAGLESAIISKNVQGATFYWDKLFVSQSLGILPSKLLLFENDADTNNFEANRAIKEFPFPSMMEQIYVDGNDLYFIFESGAYAYNGLPTFAVDRILKVNIEELQKLVKENSKKTIKEHKRGEKKELVCK